MAPMSQARQHVPMENFIARMLDILPCLFIPQELMMASVIVAMEVTSMQAKPNAQIHVGRPARRLELN
nr:hypothetical protein Iba_chr07bCG11040 [Ipomoea batatas]GMD16491.1 hypothetical protein Iba_chr07cCG9910 [Ipomoea batatas]GMD18016.1 hypothetical protein Iba_chr07dCG9210 [Ipomoea batatas]GMD19407.1 hypothetical protein Iba_chr07eCG7940 [Ipomoea batatas]